MADILNALRYPKQCIQASEGQTDITTQKDGSLLWDIHAQQGYASANITLKGSQTEGVISYCKTKSGLLRLHRHINFVNINIKPNKKYNTFAYNFYPKIELMLDGVEITKEKPTSVLTKDSLVITSGFMNGATVVRSFYPSPKHPAFIEKIEVTNNVNAKVMFTAAEVTKRLSGKSKAVKKVGFGTTEGKLEVGGRLVDANGDFRSANQTTAKKLLVAGASATCYIVYYAIKRGESLNFNAEKEIKDYLKSLSLNN